MTRKHYDWKVKSETLQLGERTLVMGILNVTPDSFSDGGKYHDPDRAYARAIELEDQGVDIIDIGGESTRPGAARISEAEEMRRLVPVLKRLREKVSVPISVDTYKTNVAEKALDLGAAIINDPSGLTFDPGLAKIVAKYDAGLILNHMRGTPESWAKLPPLPDVMGTITTEVQATIHRAMRSGVDKSRIVIDPGLGFGKRKEQNSEIIARVPQFASLGFPILMSPSRKSFLARATVEETMIASVAAVVACILGGAHIVRVHDAVEMKVASQVADAILAASPQS
jgi:dihydropteroate synthase